MALVLGIDVSTTATKAILIDPEGVVRGIGAGEYGVSMPQPLWSEQDPAAWWSATQSAVGVAL
ncbi:MAG TPA: FGGY family carbohydrate kinase, partial [Candidatus Limnocylindria bacterium]|nr:FGGY family carbohydrate kinase [Candidatus Limnocylindria bacterium]